MNFLLRIFLLLGFLGVVESGHASMQDTPPEVLAKSILPNLESKDLAKGLGFVNKRLHALSDEVLLKSLVSVNPEELAEIGTTRAVVAKQEASRRLKEEFFTFMKENQQAEAISNPLDVYMKIYREAERILAALDSFGPTGLHLKPKHLPILKFFANRVHVQVSDSDIMILSDEQIVYAAQLLKDVGVENIGFVQGTFPGAWRRPNGYIFLRDYTPAEMPHELSLFMRVGKFPMDGAIMLSPGGLD